MLMMKIKIPVIICVLSLLFTVQAMDTKIEAEPEVINHRLRVDNAEKWKTSDNNFLLHLRCKITTRQHRITIGAASDKLKDSDLVSFDDFRLILPDKTIVTAFGLGHTIMGQVTLYKAPKEHCNLVNINAQNKYEWNVDVIFVLQKGTSSVLFQFSNSKLFTIVIPVEIE